MAKKRIDYIDLAKGVCMSLVVFWHSGFPISISGLSYLEMPLFFMLSGLFFKDYGGWKPFIIKKINTIIIPFLFFYLSGYVVFYLLKWLKPELLITDARGIMDIFDNRQFFNGPTWFLLALFWCHCFFFFITTRIKSDFIKAIIICLLGFIGWYLGYKKLFIPCFIDVALTTMPFFTMGYFLKKTNILYPNNFDKYNILFVATFWFISWFIGQNLHQRLSLHYNIIEGWSTYLLSFTSVMSALFLCKIIKNVPFITYVGRYSIIILCVHHLIYRPLIVFFRMILPESEFVSFLIALATLLLSAACIPFFKRYLPWFCAQKDLISV